MGYYLDFQAITLTDFQNRLETAELLPSRRLLKEQATVHFPVLRNQGFQNLGEVYELLRTKPRLKSFAQKTGIEEDYLTLLLRELNSYRPKPSKLADFKYIPVEVVKRLNQQSIKNTLQLYPHILEKSQRSSLAKRLKVDLSWIDRLAALSDLCRVKWVNHTFAYMLYSVGFDRLDKLQKANIDDLHRKINEINKREGIYKGQIGRHDIELCVQASRELTEEIIWE